MAKILNFERAPKPDGSIEVSAGARSETVHVHLSSRDRQLIADLADRNGKETFEYARTALLAVATVIVAFAAILAALIQRGGHDETAQIAKVWPEAFCEAPNTVQVASLRDPRNATKLAREIRAFGFESFFSSATVEKKARLRVCVVAESRRVAEKIKAKLGSIDGCCLIHE